MTAYQIAKVSTATNNGIACEHDFCAHMGINRTHHDHANYMAHSDVETGDFNISVKSARFTLMAGKVATDNGLTSFDEIVDFYFATTHSNMWAYVTKDRMVYMMNADEFQTFVYAFCGMERESTKNGGGLKLKARMESKKMLRWLEEHRA